MEKTLINEKESATSFHKIPYPLVHGGAIAQYYFLQSLAETFNITYATVLKNPREKQNLLDLSNNLQSIEVKYYQAYSDDKSRLSKTKSIIKSLLPYKRIKAFMGQVGIQKGFIFPGLDDFDWANQPLEMYPKEIMNFLNNLIEKNNIDIIQLDFFESISLLAAVPKELKKVFVHHEIRAKRLLLAQNSSASSKEFLNYVTSCNQLVENSLLKLADTVIVFNDHDKTFLRQVHDNIVVSPFGLPEEVIIKKNTSSEFKHLFFIGGQEHQPNKEGLEWFLNNVFLLHHRQINRILYIIGFWDAHFIQQYSVIPEIIFTGKVEDLTRFYEQGIMVAPVFSGSGLRTKIINAFANRVPVVTTEFACEGLQTQGEIAAHLITFESDSAFLEIMETFSNDELAAVANEGRRYFDQHFNRDLLTKTRIRAILS